MTLMTEAHLDIPSMFAVSRAIQYSNGALTANSPTDPGKFVAIPLQNLSGRGSKCSFGDAYEQSSSDGNKIKSINTPNPQSGDAAFLPPGSDTLQLSFSMNVLSVTTEQQMCNDMEFTRKMKAFLSAFGASGGFHEIARMVVWRVANASALWRNRYGINKRVEIVTGQQRWEFAADNISLTTPDGFTAPDDLVKLIGDALAGKSGVLMLNVAIFVTLGNGQEVFPSQEMVMGGKADNDKDKDKDKDSSSKMLYAIPLGDGQTAAMHPQKIGAAIRAFDIWHPQYAELGPLSIEPLGYSHKHQHSLREPSTKTDLYTYLPQLEQLTGEIESKGFDHRALFLVGCLMRGGVFSGLSEKKKAEFNTKKPKAKAKTKAETEAGAEA